MSAYTPETIVWRMSLVANLQNLPLEILELIFKSLRPLDHSLPPSANLSRYISADSYEKLHLSYPHLLQLCRSINGSPRLARMIIEIQCFSYDRSIDYQPEDEKPLFDFFRSATSLTSLDVRYCPRLRSRLLSAKFALASYRNLKHLSLDSSSSNPPRSLAHQYRYLPLFRHVERLSIMWEMGSNNLSDEPVFEIGEIAQFTREDRAALQAAGVDVPYETKIESLDLCADWLNREGVVEFISKLTSLTALWLTIDLDDGYIDLSNLLAAVNPNLLQLHVDYCEGSEATSLSTELPLLLALSNLTKLERLAFGNAPEYATLRQLVTAPIKPPALTHLVAWIPDGREGVSHLDDDYFLDDFCDVQTGEIRIGPGWFTASWGGGDGIQEIFQKARESGVKLEGNWDEARWTSRAHREEMEWCSTFRIEENLDLQRRNNIEEFDEEEWSDDPCGLDIEPDGRGSNKNAGGDDESGVGSGEDEESEDEEGTVDDSETEASETHDYDVYDMDRIDSSDGGEMETRIREAEIDVDTFVGERKENYERQAEDTSDESSEGEYGDTSGDEGTEVEGSVGDSRDEDGEFSYEASDSSDLG